MMYRKSVVACNTGKYTKTILMYFTKYSVLIIHTLALVAKSGFVRPVKHCYILVPHFCKLILIYSLLLFRM